MRETPESQRVPKKRKSLWSKGFYRSQGRSQMKIR